MTRALTLIAALLLTAACGSADDGPDPSPLTEDPALTPAVEASPTPEVPAPTPTPTCAFPTPDDYLDFVLTFTRQPQDAGDPTEACADIPPTTVAMWLEPTSECSARWNQPRYPQFICGDLTETGEETYHRGIGLDLSLCPATGRADLSQYDHHNVVCSSWYSVIVTAPER